MSSLCPHFTQVIYYFVCTSIDNTKVPECVIQKYSTQVKCSSTLQPTVSMKSLVLLAVLIKWSDKRFLEPIAIIAM